MAGANLISADANGVLSKKKKMVGIFWKQDVFLFLHQMTWMEMAHACVLYNQEVENYSLVKLVVVKTVCPLIDRSTKSSV